MNLLSEETLVFTIPAPMWALKKLRTFGAIPQEKQDKIAQELPLLTQYLLTFSSATIREEGLRSKYIREVSVWFESKYGLEPHKYSKWFREKFFTTDEGGQIDYPEGDKLSKEEAGTIYLETLDIARWATVMVCLKKVQTRKVPMTTQEDSDIAWKDTPIPDEWKEFSSFLETFPPKLFEEAVSLCDVLNPGVWFTRMDDDSKNFGGVSALR